MLSPGYLPRLTLVLALAISFSSTNRLVSAQGDFRLPSNLVPSHYDIQILVKPTPADDFTFTGVVKIDLTCVEATDTIVIHNYELQVDEAAVVLEV